MTYRVGNFISLLERTEGIGLLHKKLLHVYLEVKLIHLRDQGKEAVIRGSCLQLDFGEQVVEGRKRVQFASYQNEGKKILEFLGKFQRVDSFLQRLVELLLWEIEQAFFFSTGQAKEDAEKLIDYIFGAQFNLVRYCNQLLKGLFLFFGSEKLLSLLSIEHEEIVLHSRRPRLQSVQSLQIGEEELGFEERVKEPEFEHRLSILAGGVYLYHARPNFTEIAKDVFDSPH